MQNTDLVFGTFGSWGTKRSNWGTVGAFGKSGKTVWDRGRPGPTGPSVGRCALCAIWTALLPAAVDEQVMHHLAFVIGDETGTYILVREW